MRALPPLIVHVIHELGVGGLENGVVNLINHMPHERYRHAVVCMTRYTEFKQRILRTDVDVIALERGSVPIWRTYIALIAYFLRVKPAIVHSRNLSGLDGIIPALLAGVAVRVHSEHGRDADDLDGRNPKSLRLRRLFRPFVKHYCAVSRDLQRYLADVVAVPADRIAQIYNGVDTEKFRPAEPRTDRAVLGIEPNTIIIGAIGRLQPVKDHVTLVMAFAEARRLDPHLLSRARLVIVGDGPCREQIAAAVRRADIERFVLLLGERTDIADILRAFDLFVQPSLSEGISNTVLEAMASGLPVLATRVGGNPELVIENETGQLVDSGDLRAMASWITRYVGDEGLRRRQSVAARHWAVEKFSMAAMVRSYMNLYDRLLAGGGRAEGVSPGLAK